MSSSTPSRPLAGRVALVAGATRGCGRALAVELGRVETDHGRLDVLVNDIFGGDRYAAWGTKVWEHDLAGGLRMLRMGIDTHLVTTTYAVPLMLRSPGPGLLVEVTDGTREHNAQIRPGVGFYYDAVKGAVDRMVRALAVDLADTPVTALGVTPGWLRSEAMLESYGVAEDTWHDAVATAPGFAISETPTYLARGVAALAADPDAGRFGGEVLTARDLSDTYGTTDVDGSRPDAWAWVRAGHPEAADVIASYR